MRKLRRNAAFDITLEVKDEAFIQPPRENQRHWLLNRAITEFADDLLALDGLARDFVSGEPAVEVQDRAQVELSDAEIMEDWQIPLMRSMAAAATETHGDVLEIGFGRGISAGFIQDCGVRSHTIVECNPSVIQRFHTWRQAYPERDIRLIEGKWQEVTDRFETYDGVFFHTFPLDEDEYLELAIKSITFAEHFFPTAAGALRPEGIFTYMTNEIDSLSRAHQRLLLRHFRSFSLALQPLELPPGSRDTWWANSMVVVKAVK